MIHSHTKRSPLAAILAAGLLSVACQSSAGVRDSDPYAGGAGEAAWFKTPDAPGGMTTVQGEGMHDAPTPGISVEAGPFPHDMEPTQAGRMYLLELYQETIEDNEALEHEVAGLTQALDRTYAELDEAQRQAAELGASLKAAEKERERLKAENVDLAGRLSTAQLRRLEAEKLLLEAKIEWAEFLEREEQDLVRGSAGRRP